MDSERTELQWTYQPADFFEVRIEYPYGDHDLLIEDGRAIATLRIPQDPVPEALDKQIGNEVAVFFVVRRLLIHRRFELGGLRVIQYAGQKKIARLRALGIASNTSVRRADIIARDSSGEVIHDSKAERIASDTALLVSVAPKLAESPTLRALVASYSAAVTDPGNEIIHLYEVRDALAKYYGTEETARTSLRISTEEWNRLGRLANTEPLQQGRHLGKHPVGLRAATAEELEDARAIVRRWVVAFAGTIA